MLIFIISADYFYYVLIFYFIIEFGVRFTELESTFKDYSTPSSCFKHSHTCLYAILTEHHKLLAAMGKSVNNPNLHSEWKDHKTKRRFRQQYQTGQEIVQKNLDQVH